MKPDYVNTFGLRKVTSPDGDILEITLDASYKYMETALSATNKGIENISSPTAQQVASVVMTKQSALSLRNLLIQTLGDL